MTGWRTTQWHLIGTTLGVARIGTNGEHEGFSIYDDEYEERSWFADDNDSDIGPTKSEYETRGEAMRVCRKIAKRRAKAKLKRFGGTEPAATQKEVPQ